MRIANEFPENMFTGGKLPTGAEAIANVIDDKAAPLGALLIRHSTGIYSLWWCSSARSCNQREAKRIHEEVLRNRAGGTQQESFAKKLSAIVTASGMSQKRFSESFKTPIPLRTLENWLSGSRTPAPWEQQMILSAAEDIIRRLENSQE